MFYSISDCCLSFYASSRMNEYQRTHYTSYACFCSTFSVCVYIIVTKIQLQHVHIQRNHVTLLRVYYYDSLFSLCSRFTYAHSSAIGVHSKMRTGMLSFFSIVHCQWLISDFFESHTTIVVVVVITIIVSFKIKVSVNRIYHKRYASHTCVYI